MHFEQYYPIAILLSLCARMARQTISANSPAISRIYIHFQGAKVEQRMHINTYGMRRRQIISFSFFSDKKSNTNV
jgi:hypothetical protein